MSGARALPDFICVGAPKSGTSWLYDALSARPDVFIAAAKGTNFFDREYARGLDWYAAHFAKAPPGARRGEISHDYYSHAEAPARIARKCRRPIMTPVASASAACQRRGVMACPSSASRSSRRARGRRAWRAAPRPATRVRGPR